MKGDGDSPLAVVIASAALLGLYALLRFMQPMICPHPVYAHEGMVTLSCDGSVPAPEVKR